MGLPELRTFATSPNSTSILNHFIKPQWFPTDSPRANSGWGENIQYFCAGLIVTPDETINVSTVLGKDVAKFGGKVPIKRIRMDRPVIARYVGSFYITWLEKIQCTINIKVIRYMEFSDGVWLNDRVILLNHDPVKSVASLMSWAPNNLSKAKGVNI